MFEPFEELVIAVASGVGFVAFGVAVAVRPSRRVRTIWALAVPAAVILGSWSVSPRAAVAELCLGTVFLLAVAAVWFVRRISAHMVPGRFLRPSVVGTVLSLGGAGLIAAGSWHYDVEGYKVEREIEFVERMSGWHPDLVDAGIDTKTDSGLPIPVYSATDPRPKPKVREDEKALLAGFDWGKRVIQRASGDDVSNCHGWVFTGGKYWVKGHDVPTILSGNGYRAESRARVGDVAAYFDNEGKIAHTGIVRSVGAITMVESKWGWMGVYLHAAEDSCYGANIVYYHGPRKGHQLAAINPADAEPAPTFGFGRRPGERPPIR